MERFIPREKLSKRARKALDSGRRVMWVRSPVTRRTKNGKAYDRKKDLRGQEEMPGDPFFTAVCAKERGRGPFDRAACSGYTYPERYLPRRRAGTGGSA